MDGSTNANVRSARYQRYSKTVTIANSVSAEVSDCRLTIPKGIWQVSIYINSPFTLGSTVSFVLGMTHTEGGAWMQQSYVGPLAVGRQCISYTIKSNSDSYWVQPRFWHNAGSDLDIFFEIVAVYLGVE